jgi:hypothetical protein
MQTIELLFGSNIVVSTLADVFQSVVVPSPTRRSLRLAPLQLDGMWPLWKLVAHYSYSPKHREDLLRSAYADSMHTLMKDWVVSLRKKDLL